MLDGIDSLEPVGQYRRVNCLFETSTNFKRPTPWSKHSIPGVKSMKSHDSIRCSSNNNTLVQVFNSWSANVSILAKLRYISHITASCCPAIQRARRPNPAHQRPNEINGIRYRLSTLKYPLPIPEQIDIQKIREQKSFQPRNRPQRYQRSEAFTPTAVDATKSNAQISSKSVLATVRTDICSPIVCPTAY